MTTIIPEFLRLLCQNAAAKNDMRYYLLGVYVEPGKSETDWTRLVGCDGHRMSMIACRPVGSIEGVEGDYPGHGKAPENGYIMGRESIMDAYPMTRLAKAPQVLGEAGDEAASVMLGDRRILCVDGKYPDWRSVMPDAEARDSEALDTVKDSGVLPFTRLSPDYLMQMGRMHKALNTMSGGVGVMHSVRIKAWDDSSSVLFEQAGTISLDTVSGVESEYMGWYAATIIMPTKN